MYIINTYNAYSAQYKNKNREGRKEGEKCLRGAIINNYCYIYNILILTDWSEKIL
jgi:hypothetical protein